MVIVAHYKRHRERVRFAPKRPQAGSRKRQATSSGIRGVSVCYTLSATQDRVKQMGYENRVGERFSKVSGRYKLERSLKTPAGRRAIMCHDVPVCKLMFLLQESDLEMKHVVNLNALGLRIIVSVALVKARCASRPPAFNFPAFSGEAVCTCLSSCGEKRGVLFDACSAACVMSAPGGTFRELVRTPTKFIKYVHLPHLDKLLWGSRTIIEMEKSGLPFVRYEICVVCVFAPCFLALPIAFRGRAEHQGAKSGTHRSSF